MGEEDIVIKVDENIPDDEGELRKYLDKMMMKADYIEQELKEHNQVLQAQKNIGMDGPLLDQYNFPRADIDLVAIRKSRNRIICLKNDQRRIMDFIDVALTKLHQMNPKVETDVVSSSNGDNSGDGATTGDGDGGSDTSGGKKRQLTRPPFLRVGGVIIGSPAYESGLMDEDLICQIGSLHKDNFSKLSDVAEVVSHYVNRAVAVKLIRAGTPKTIALKPKPWAGSGVLGCNVNEM